MKSHSSAVREVVLAATLPAPVEFVTTHLEWGPLQEMRSARDVPERLGVVSAAERRSG
jgi:hypothetical protein